MQKNTTSHSGSGPVLNGTLSDQIASFNNLSSELSVAVNRLRIIKTTVHSDEGQVWYERQIAKIEQLILISDTCKRVLEVKRTENSVSASLS